MNRENKYRIYEKPGVSAGQMILWEELIADEDFREGLVMVLLGQLPDSVLMQFTGLHDKHGVEIYEGDILQFQSTFEEHGSDGVEIYEVRWLSYGFGAEWLNPRSADTVSDPVLSLQGANEDMLVIGNIHETRHLVTAAAADGVAR